MSKRKHPIVFWVTLFVATIGIVTPVVVYTHQVASERLYMTYVEHPTWTEVVFVTLTFNNSPESLAAEFKKLAHLDKKGKYIPIEGVPKGQNYQEHFIFWLTHRKNIHVMRTYGVLDLDRMPTTNYIGIRSDGKLPY
jgi:hypothetical protein